MKFFRFAKDHSAEAVFIVLIALCLYIYFVVYMTPSRVYWYHTMMHQLTYMFQTFIVNKLTAIGH
jgi:hypothetical protein